MLSFLPSRLLRILAVSTLVLNCLQATCSQTSPPHNNLRAQASQVVFAPFDSDKLGKSDLTHVQTATAAPREVTRGKSVFQVIANKRTGHELFRVLVGNTEAKWWVYGLLLEADFNGDGVPDFSWHGGDDTSTLNLIALSQNGRYRKVDVYTSLEREWKRRFPSDPLEELNASDTATVTEIKLVRKSGKLTLEALVSFTDLNKKNIEDIKPLTHRVQVPESRFFYVK